MCYSTIGKAVASLAILAMPVIVVCKVAADCPNFGAIDQGCDVGQGTDSGCAGGNEADCEEDTAQTSVVGRFGCDEVEGRKNCRTGTGKALCYTVWQCVWLTVSSECVPDPSSEDRQTWWIKTDDECPPEEPPRS